MILGLLIGAVCLVLCVVVMYERTIKIIRASHSLPTTETAAPILPPQTLLSEPIEPTEPNAEEFKAMFLNEDEEDIKWMLESGKISKEQVPEVLDALGISNEVHFS